MDQNDYINSICQIPLQNVDTHDLHHSLNGLELKQLRGALGQLNWISGMTRPEVSFHVCEISTHIKSATISDVVAINKVIKFTKSTPSYITFPKMHKSSLQIQLFSDASFNNLPDGGSQGGHIAFLKDEHHKMTPISWSSTRIKRIARSTLAAETLALTAGCDSAFFLSQLLAEIRGKQTDIHALTDNKSLCDTVDTTKQILDRRLRVEVSALREMCNKQEIKLSWIRKEKQLSDVLIKKEASYHSLIEVLQSGLSPL